MLSAISGFTSGSFAQGLKAAATVRVTAAAGGAHGGDFNEDGRADLLVYGAASGRR